MKIGIMSFAHMHAYSYAEGIARLPNTELVGIFDDDVERGKAAAEKYNTTHYGDQASFLTSDVDAVIICSENSRHKEMVLHAAKEKKNILCEKPIATNVEDAREMIQACEENNVILQIAYPVRFSSPISELKEMVDADNFGEIIAFRTTNRGLNPGGWFIESELSGGGAVFDHTVHMVDIMRWYLGAEVTKVNAYIDSYFHNINVDDAGLLTLEFENGVIASHDASWSRFSEYPTWGDATIEIIGTKQTVRVDAFGEKLNVFREGNKSLEYKVFGTDMDFSLIRDFIDCIEKNREPSITGYDGLKSLEVALAAYEAHKTKNTIEL